MEQGWIAAAGLDVLEQEPPDPENPLIHMDNVILTPHVAASTTEASIVVAEMAANQVSKFLLNGIKVNTV